MYPRKQLRWHTRNKKHLANLQIKEAHARCRWCVDLPLPGKESLLWTWQSESPIFSFGLPVEVLSFGLLVERTPSPEGRDEVSSELSLGNTFSLGLADMEPMERFAEEPPPSELDGKTFRFNVFDWGLESCFLTAFLYGVLGALLSGCLNSLTMTLPSAV